MMSEIRAERLTAETDGEFVVFLIGMRINKLWKIQQGARASAGVESVQPSDRLEP